MTAQTQGSSLIEDIVREGVRNGLPQKALAARAGITEEALSRMKRRGSGHLWAVQQLAQAAGMRLILASDSLAQRSRANESEHPRAAPPPPERSRFRDRHPEIVWSNRGADDTVYIRRALLDPRFTTLLDAAQEFGIERLEREWGAIMSTPTHEARRAQPMTNRILGNIRRGYEQASR